MKKTINALAASLLCLSATASGSSLTLLWDSTPYNPNPPAGPFNYSLNGSGGTISPDRYHGEVTAVMGIDPATLVDGGSTVPVSLFTYCYELTQFFSGGSSVDYQIIPGSVGITSATLDFLGAVNSTFGGNSFGWLHPAGVNAANQAAAIQIGIWETLYDSGSFNITSGNFTISGLGSGAGSVGDYLSQYAGLMATTANLSSNVAIRLSNADAQDQITGIRPVSQQVPEPGSLALLALGLAVTGITLRRRIPA